MVDYDMDIHKSLYHTDDVPQDMVDMRVEVVARLKSLEEAAAPLVTFLQNPNVVQELRADKKYNLQMLNDYFHIGPEQIEALYQYAKFQFECGNYSGAADNLYQYRALCTNAERSLNSKNFTSLLNQVQSRIWLMHKSFFIFFNHDNGKTQIIDLFNQDKYLNAIQINAPHLLCYLAAAFIVNKKRRPQFKEFIKGSKKMKECEDVILNDPFLGKRVEESNYTVVPLKDEFIENARLFIFKTYCRIHECIDMQVLAEKLNLNYEDAERWILNLIRTLKLDAKIDTQTGTVVMEPNHPNAYEQLNDHTKGLSGCTYKLVNQLMEHAQNPTSLGLRKKYRLNLKNDMPPRDK
nr:eukaryotic translation initiation factor 3 subunit E [Tanacetum cinerariifolium]